MKKRYLWTVLLAAATLPWQAHASTFDFSFAGPGVSGSLTLTYGTATDAKYPQAYKVTGVTGTITDVNNGLNLVNVPVGALIPIRNDAPESTNLLAPNDFSRFAVAAGLGPESNGFISYDNLLYPAGSPPTATDYQIHGGFLDIYGLMFEIGNGRVANFWSNGDFTMTGNGPINYGLAIVTPAEALDYVGGVSITPEPSVVGLLGMGSGFVGMLVWRRRASRLAAESK